MSEVMLGLKVSAAAKERLADAARETNWPQTAVLEHMLSPLSDTDTLALFGLRPERMTLALAAWGNLLARASEEVSALLVRQEWNYLADVCNGLMVEPGTGNPDIYLWAEAEDGHRLGRMGDRWFSGSDLPDAQGRKRADKAVAALSLKLRALAYVQAWAVIAAIQWFWDHAQEQVDHTADEWWSLAFRRHHAQKYERGPLANKPERE